MEVVKNRFRIKTEKDYIYDLEVSEDSEREGVFYINVFDLETREKVANSFYRIRNNLNELRSPLVCYLGNIQIDNKAYTKRGIGTEILKTMEYLAGRSCVTIIEGKFYPHDETMENVIKFYEKNGYSVDMFDKEIYKRIDRMSLRQPNIVDEKVNEGEDAELSL